VEGTSSNEDISAGFLTVTTIAPPTIGVRQFAQLIWTRATASVYARATPRQA
jgi:hypothetical protein